MCRITNGFPGYGGTFEDVGETDRQTKTLPENGVSSELGVLCVSAVTSFVNDSG